MAQAAIPQTAPAGTPHAGGPPPGAPSIPDFEIVPRKGLPFVAVAIVVLVVGIALNELWGLIFLHVAAGAAWTIIDLFLGFVIGPILGRLSIPARIELTTRLMPKMVLIMPTVVDGHARRRLAARDQARHQPDRATRSHGWIVASFIVVAVDGGDRARAARAGEHRGAHRAEEAAAQPGGHRETDEALHLHRPGPPGLMQIATL